MKEPKIRVGTVGYPIARNRVLAQVDVVELTEGRQIPPRKAAARRWRSSAPDRVAFTVQLSRYLVDPLEGGVPMPGERSGYGGLKLSDENLGLWKRELEFASAVDALALVLITPPTLTPAVINRRLLTDFLAGVERAHFSLIWEPHGPWESEQATEFALENDLVLAVDPLRDPAPAGPLAYFRMGPFASMGSRVGLYDLERIMDAGESFDRTICVFETPRAFDDARNLKKVLSGDDASMGF